MKVTQTMHVHCLSRFNGGHEYQVFNHISDLFSYVGEAEVTFEVPDDIDFDALEAERLERNREAKRKELIEKLEALDAA
jgi:hypothetical protein